MQQEADPIMDHLITHFNTLFFQGKLLPVRFEWSSEAKSRGVCRHNAAGEVVISVNPSPASAQAGEERAWSILGTLLHECVHAVFKHSCCEPIPPHEIHNDDCEDGIGWTGRGPEWEALAREVEARAQRIMGDDVDFAY